MRYVPAIDTIIVDLVGFGLLTDDIKQAIVAALEPPAPKKKSHKCLVL